MIVRLPQTVFEGVKAPDTLLIRLLDLGRRGHIALRLSPRYRAAGDDPVHVWLERQSSDVRDKAILALRQGVGDQTDQYSGTRPRVVQISPVPDAVFAASGTGHVSAQLPLSDETVDFLLRPLRLLVENARNDRAFLLKACPSTWRAQLDNALKSNRLTFENGGGLQEIRKMVQEQLKDDARRSVKTFALFDHDGDGPQSPSPESERCVEAFRDLGIAHHRLERRAIENYLPREALDRWAASVKGTAEQSKRKTWVGEIFQLGTLRHHFHFKHGISTRRGEPRPELEARYLQEGHPPARVKLLSSGYDVAPVTWGDRAFPISEAELDSDGSRAERVHIFQSIFAAM